jgi:hypothetical protein
LTKVLPTKPLSPKNEEDKKNLKAIFLHKGFDLHFLAELSTSGFETSAACQMAGRPPTE